jgi:hypothetical protein
MIKRPLRFRPPAMEPKINQQLSNSKYGQAKECRPSGVLKVSWGGLILCMYFIQGRPSLQRNRKTKMIAAE